MILRDLMCGLSWVESIVFHVLAVGQWTSHWAFQCFSSLVQNKRNKCL